MRLFFALLAINFTAVANPQTDKTSFIGGEQALSSIRSFTRNAPTPAATLLFSISVRRAGR
jgi:hypothetical protein